MVVQRITKLAVIISALVASVAVLPSAVSAQERPVLVNADPVDTRSERVSFAALDLSQPRDQKRLNHRVGGAIERVCLRDIGRDGLQDRSYDRCAAGAWDNATPQIASAIAMSRQLALSGGPPYVATAILVSAP